MNDELNLQGNLLNDELDLLTEEDKIAMSSLWLAGEAPEKREEVINTLRNSGYQFDKLRVILRRMYREAQKREEAIEAPNWRDRAAYNMGYKKALRDIYALIPKTTQE
jgi:hypothetical protein